MLFSVISCGKDSGTDPEDEDRIVVRFAVSQDGSPLENIMIRIAATVKALVAGPTDVDSPRVITLEQNTDTNCNAKFTFVNRSLEEKDCIYIKTMEVRTLSEILHEATLEKRVDRNTEVTIPISF